ncbi:hypothetical protein GCM10027594_11300 [Hymenobacter agri]
MKFPINAADIEKEILTSVGKYQEHRSQRIKQLTYILQKADAELVVEGVIRVFERESGERNYAQQEFAGQILEIVRPTSLRNPKELLQRVLTHWNKSVEQLPFWLRENYGIDKLTEVFAQLALTAVENDKLETMKWWLHLNEAQP